MLLARGDRLGPYEIEAPLGAGAMGEVYRARDPRLDRFVAIKLLTGAGGGDARTQLEREARAAAALNHPHICTIHEIASAGDRLFIVMEQVDGRRLSELVAEGVSIDAIVRYGAQMADALAHAHERGVVHRDLKSANLMVTADGRVKVLDFGIARLTADTSALAATRAATSPGTLAGTPAYMAPEVLKGIPADRRSDIWAIGVVLYEMAAGRRPFDGGTSIEISSAILRDQPEPLERRVPAPLRGVIARCLAKDPALRYQQAGEVRAALEAIASFADQTAAAPAQRETAVPTTPSAGSGMPAPDGLTGHEKSLIVLPFANLSPESDDAYFSDGLTEELISDLSNVRSLRVISRTSAMRLKGAAEDLKAIAREVGVRYVLEGSVRRHADSVRIAVRLIDAPADTQIWSEKFTETPGNVFALQEKLSNAITAALRVRLSEPERKSLTKRPVTAEVQDLLLKGRFYHYLWSEDGLQRAIALFKEAIDKDPNYAPSYAALAETHAMRAFMGRADPLSGLSQVLTAATRALDLDDSLASARALVGVASLLVDFDWDRAGRSFERAIELNPGDPAPRTWYGALYLNALGRSEAAMRQTRHWMALDPLNPAAITDLGWELYNARDFERAIAELDRALAMSPAYAAALWTRGLACEQQSRFADAIAAHERAVAASEGSSLFRAGLARACAAAGRRDDARRILGELEQEATKAYVSQYQTAAAYVALGDAESARAWMERGLISHDGWMIFANVDPQFDRVRNDAWFRSIVARMNLPGISGDRASEPTLSLVSESPHAKPRIGSLAVLPLENLSRDPDQEYFADGMTEALITELAQIAGLRVISRTSVMRFKGTMKPMAELVGALGVDGIVTGSVLRAGDRVRISAQLVHAPTDAHVWAHSYERQAIEVLSLQRDVASAIANEIRATTGAAPESAAVPARRVDPEAYADYLKGRHRWHYLTEADVRKAMEHFQAALARDPAYAPAYAGLALCHIGLSWMGAVVPSQACPRAKTAAIRAIELDDSLWEPRIALGYVANTYDWDWTAAERELNAAVARQPGASDVHLFYSFYFTARGRYEEAEAALIRAHELDPLSALVMSNLGYAAFFARRYEKATDYCRQTLDLDPSHIGARWIAGIALAGQERYAEAIAELDGARRVWTGVPILGWLGYACARAGQHDRARDLLATLAAMPPDRIARSYEIARIHVGLGDVDAALADIERACDTRETEVAGHLGVDPSMDPLRSEERFKAVLRRVGL